MVWRGWWLAVGLVWVAAAAAQLPEADGLAAGPVGDAIQLYEQGRELPVRVRLELRDPATGQIPPGMKIGSAWTARDGYLRLDGTVEAEGEQDRVADLIVHVEGAELPLGTMATEPLLLPKKLLSKLPLVSLRVGGADRLALAIPPDRLAVAEFRAVEGGVELRFPFGFTRDARPELRMQAPFACILYRTDPAWHFRSALASYYRFFPGPFTPFVSDTGGWFFAAETDKLPNPQHFAYHEGGPTGWEEDAARGMGTYPYRESSSHTIWLSGDKPKNYDEAMARFAALEHEQVPAGWARQQSYRLDETTAHSGKRSLLADAGPKGEWAGALQELGFDTPINEPITVEGWSRAEGVSGEPDNSYALYVDCVYQDGTYLFGQCATFPTGTHDWAQGHYVIRPAKPVARLRVFCLLRGHQGKAWFDDVRVGPERKPAVNWLRNPSFEELHASAETTYVRDNVCQDANGHWTFWITDNLAADVGPPKPLNLLRFSLNVDPDLPSTPEHPSVAATEYRYYEDIFRGTPRLGGAYIDSVSSWCAGILNTRRDQWPAARVAFTYDPGTRKVASHGKYAMMKFLGGLQERFHPQHKAVFTNIHVSLETFPLYLVSDVPGIESSLFDDEDSMFYYRAASFRKPLLLLNFMNLHHLDQRPVAERYHRNAGQFGLVPSTGRFVQEAYQLYGDVTHAWLPAIQDLNEAGWQPVPLAHGGRVERFASEEAAYLTVRGESEQHLVLEPPALPAPGATLVAWDAVKLEPVAVTRAADGLHVDLPAGEVVRVVRISSRASATAWLADRARRHLLNATRVRGQATADAELTAAAERLAKGTADVPALRKLLAARLAAIPAETKDLFALSVRRELAAADRALELCAE